MIEAIQFWNEPNNLSHWDYTIDPNWDAFSTMVHYASNEVRKEAPSLTQVLGGLSPLDPGFVDLMRRQGVLERVDVLALHGFPLDWNLWPINEWPEKVVEMQHLAD
ncbi:MAG: beta-xylosidase, partial [Chloroflexota bacterium]